MIASGGNPMSSEWLGLFAIITLVVWSVCNLLRIDHVGWLNNMFAFVHAATIVLIITLLLVYKKSVESAEEVFLNYENYTGFPFAYVVLLALINAGFVFTGYETPAHLAEETTGLHFAAEGILCENIL